MRVEVTRICKEKLDIGVGGREEENFQIQKK
jgi:hypothetical protein